MKKILIMVLACTMIGMPSCNTSRRHSSVMSATEFRDEVRESGQIVIPDYFRPTIELTDKIKNTPLETLIIETEEALRLKAWEIWRAHPNDDVFDENDLRTKFTKNEQEVLRDYWPTLSEFDHDYMMSETKLYFVNPNSDLAKVFYLQDKRSFKKYNMDYYTDVKKKKEAAEDEKRDAERAASWKKYGWE